MKKINKIEEVKNKDVRLEDVGINRTFYWAYIRTQETTNKIFFEVIVVFSYNLINYTFNILYICFYNNTSVYK